MILQLSVALAWGWLAAAGGSPNWPAARLVADTTITVRTTGSALEFVPARVAVRHGTSVHLVYINQGTLPHNLVLVRDANDIDLLASAALDAAKSGYVPLEHRSRFITHTGLTTPGDSVAVEFVVPPPGEYLFVCLYPGHSSMMVGTFRSLR